MESMGKGLVFGGKRGNVNDEATDKIIEIAIMESKREG
jgi:hypothetical protein